eukprot:3177113-Amphidinium_carterae.1
MGPIAGKVEPANALAKHVTTRENEQGSSVTLLLPASKMDAQAFGVERKLGCSCDKLGRALCPAHVLMDHLDS